MLLRCCGERSLVVWRRRSGRVSTKHTSPPQVHFVRPLVKVPVLHSCMAWSGGWVRAEGDSILFFPLLLGEL